MAVDEDDNIYFIELCENIIYKSDQQMKKIIGKTTNQKGEPGHWCVAVVGDEVMVCDRNGNINVYSKELEYLRQITGNFIGISSDECGNLYVCDDKKSSITVLNNRGQFFRSIYSDEDGVKKLKNPCSVCVCVWSVCVCVMGGPQYICIHHTGSVCDLIWSEGYGGRGV